MQEVDAYEARLSNVLLSRQKHSARCPKLGGRLEPRFNQSSLASVTLEVRVVARLDDTDSRELAGDNGDQFRAYAAMCASRRPGEATKVCRAVTHLLMLAASIAGLA